MDQLTTDRNEDASSSSFSSKISYGDWYREFPFLMSLCNRLTDQSLLKLQLNLKHLNGKSESGSLFISFCDEELV